MAGFMRCAWLGSIAAATILTVSSVALADDWQAVKLRGDVFVYSAPTSTWVRLKRGDVVSDSSVIRTLQGGDVEFVRDRETIDLGPDTQIQIFDPTGRRYTTVREFFGAVSVEANVENVRHFSVQTPFVAAVVKGTIFSVVSNAKTSTVTVQRGKVGVEDIARRRFANITPGQQATVGARAALSVAKASAASAAATTAAAAADAAAADASASAPSNATNAGASGNAANGNGDGNGNNGNGNGNANGSGNENGNGNNGNNGNGNNGNHGNGNNGNGNGNGAKSQ
jgi:hypothetical protein